MSIRVRASALAVLALAASTSCQNHDGSTSTVSLAGNYQCGLPQATGGGFQYAATMNVTAGSEYTYGSAPSGSLEYDESSGAVRFVSGGLTVARNALYLTTNNRPRIDFYTADDTGADFILSVCYRTGNGAYPASPASDADLHKPTVGPPPSANTAIQRAGVTSGLTDSEINRSAPFELGVGDHTLSWNLATTSQAGVTCSTDLYVVPEGAQPSSGGIDYTGSTAPSVGSHTFHVSSAGSYYIAASGGAGDGACEWSATIQ